MIFVRLESSALTPETHSVIIRDPLIDIVRKLVTLTSVQYVRIHFHDPYESFFTGLL
jgi:hypothetical protein